MRLGVINFSEKHANIGTLFWATIRCLYRVPSAIFTWPQPNWRGLLKDQTLALSPWWLLSKDTWRWNHMGYVWGLRNHYSRWCRWLLCSHRVFLAHIVQFLTVFNRQPHSGSGGSEFPMPFRTRKGQRYFSNDQNRFQKVLAPFWTRNHRKHFNCLTISYVCLNLSLPFVTASITIHYSFRSIRWLNMSIPPPMVYIHLSYLQAPQSSLSI